MLESCLVAIIGWKGKIHTLVSQSRVDMQAYGWEESSCRTFVCRFGALFFYCCSCKFGYGLDLERVWAEFSRVLPCPFIPGVEV